MMVLSLFLLTGSAFAQEDSIRIVLGTHQNDTDSVFTVDFSSEENTVTITSDLFPSYELAMDSPGRLGNLDSVPFFPFPVLLQNPFTPAFLSRPGTEEQTGFFSGELFEDARTVRSGSCSIDEFLQIYSSSDSSEMNAPAAAEMKAAAGLLGLSDVLVNYRIFDEGKYVSLTGTKDGSTLFTLSFDYTDAGSTVILWGYAEGGRNYYWLLNAESVSENRMHLNTALYADKTKSGFRSVKTNPPVLTESWDFSLSDGFGELSFSGTVQPSDNLDPIFVTGSLSSSDSQILKAEARIGENTDSFVFLNIGKNNPETSADKRIRIALDDTPDDETALSLTNELTDNIMPFYFSLIQILPSEYIYRMVNLF